MIRGRCGVTPCSRVEVHRPFGEMYRLHLQGQIYAKHPTHESGFQVLTAVTNIFLDVKPCSLVEVHLLFRGT
jgi:hypothetical protein